ncbi:hypothetical protein Syun_025682 [Stephania yunnanensis]|uniref:Uncharacterized protein n=1 Tax=Stephania yunnanensis TaxID=152371 RepID=A0AAP0HV23_9MAGN
MNSCVGFTGSDGDDDDFKGSNNRWQGLHRQRRQTVTSLCWKVESSEAGLNGMKKVAKSYKDEKKLGLGLMLQNLSKSQNLEGNNFQSIQTPSDVSNIAIDMKLALSVTNNSPAVSCVHQADAHNNLKCYKTPKASTTLIDNSSDANAGTVSVPNTMFNSTIDDTILALSFKTDVATIQKIKDGFAPKA